MKEDEDEGDLPPTEEEMNKLLDVEYPYLPVGASPKDYIAAEDLEKTDFSDLLKKGWNHLYSQNYLYSRNYFQAALKKRPEDREALYGFGKSSLELGYYPESISCFRTILRKPSRTPYTDSEKEYFRYSEIKDVQWATKADMGRAFVYSGAYKEGLPYLEEVTQAYPRFVTAWFDQGYAQINSKKYREAIQSFNHTLDYLDYKHDSLCYVGLAYAYINDFFIADQMFNQASKEAPHSPAALMGKQFVNQRRAIIEKQQELPANARKHLNRLVDNFTTGLNIVQWMFMIQFFLGIFLVLLAVALAARGNETLMPYIVGATGGLTSLVAMIKSAPTDVQKNRVDFGQWMIAYYSWITALYQVTSNYTQRIQQGKEIDLEEIKRTNCYLQDLTTSTIKVMEEYCEFKSGEKPRTPAVENAGTTTKGTDVQNTPKAPPASVQPKEPETLPKG